MPRPKLSPINELSATLPSLSVNEKLARSLVSGFVSLFDPRLDELNDIGERGCHQLHSPRLPRQRRTD